MTHRGRTPRPFERGTGLPVSLTLEPRRSVTGAMLRQVSAPWGCAPQGLVRTKGR